MGGGFCWGFMGFFTRHLGEYGIDANGAIIVRCGIAALCFGILILCRDIRQFRIRLKDLWCFAGTGLFSLLFFTYCYFHAINMMSLSAAAILLYTAPTIVMQDAAWYPGSEPGHISRRRGFCTASVRGSDMRCIRSFPDMRCSVGTAAVPSTFTPACSRQQARFSSGDRRDCFRP